jgi:hypothetical protein
MMRKSLDLEIERGGVLTFAESEGSMVILIECNSIIMTKW